MDKQEKTCVCVCVWDGEGANKQNSKRGKCSFFKSRYMNVFPLFVKLYTHTHSYRYKEIYSNGEIYTI